jgi:hypothetical protein
MNPGIRLGDAFRAGMRADGGGWCIAADLDQLLADQGITLTPLRARRS